MTAVFNITAGHWPLPSKTRKCPSLALDGHEHVAKPKPKRNFLQINMLQISLTSLGEVEYTVTFIMNYDFKMELFSTSSIR
jgi:hypothetical protein